MIGSLFVASRAKLNRARQFINELDSLFEAYRARNPLLEVSEHTQNVPGLVPGGIFWTHSLNSIGHEPGIVLGDTVHNMRAALDLMASELAVLNGQKGKDVYFPFADAEDQLAVRIKSKRFDRAGDDAVKLLQTFKPYRGGNDALRALHDLDIQDKHTALIVTVQDYDVDVNFDKMFAAPLEPKSILKMRNLHFLFPEGTVLAGHHVIATLEHLMDMVNGILEAFSALVSSRATK